MNDFDRRSETALNFVRVRLNVLVSEAAQNRRSASALLSAYYKHKYEPDQRSLIELENERNRYEGMIT